MQRCTYKEIAGRRRNACYSSGNVSIVILHVLSSVGIRDVLCMCLSLGDGSSRSSYLSPLVQRIAGITAMLQQSLEGLLLEGLRTSDVDIVRHCLRTYATIDKTRDAEALVGQVLVKPYMDQVCACQTSSHRHPRASVCLQHCTGYWGADQSPRCEEARVYCGVHCKKGRAPVCHHPHAGSRARSRIFERCRSPGTVFI